MLKIRWSHDRLIFNMQISIPGKDGIYIEMWPCGLLLPGLISVFSISLIWANDIDLKYSL